MAGQRRGGIIEVRANGVAFDAKGSWSYNLGKPKRETIVGADGLHGYMEKPQPPYIEGEITDRDDLDLEALVTLSGATITLKTAIGKIIMLRQAFYAAEGKVETEEGNIEARFEGASCVEIAGV